MFFSVALLSPPFSTLTYSEPPGWNDLSSGVRAVIPLSGAGIRVGVVLGAAEKPGESVTVRSILWILDKEPLLSDEYLGMVRQFSRRHLVSEGRILSSALPGGLRLIQHTRLRIFGEKGTDLLTFRRIADAEDSFRSMLASLYRAGKADLTSPADSSASEGFRLLQDPPWPIRQNAVTMRKILDHLWENGVKSRKALLAEFPGCSAALNTLARKGLLASIPLEAPDAEDESLVPPPVIRPVPNEWQAKTISHVMDSISARKSETFLLYGVTGSGKTAVYLELAEQCISLGRSVLLLAPEVGIAVKLRRDAREYGLPVLLYHGYQSPRQKEICFRTCAALTEPKLIIGTRSALFLPLRGIGLIILDEEHDDSFKQDERLPYHAKELAWFRARSFAAPLVLGSATPDIKTFHAASEGRYPLLRLPSRAGGGEMPEIRFIDTRHARGTLSPEAVLALKDNTAQGNQSIIMLNRRGYSPLMFCLDCGKAYKCPNCDISLTYHKSRGQLVCHYCGHASPFPAPCPTCKGSHYLPMGEGTEKLEESLRTLTDAKILRLDRDTSRREGRLEEILNAFAHREADILVGTQMLSKGHHFPDVTLVLIADADVGLNMPDYRAAERTFQLLTQAAGRAGRGKKKGIVLVQTRDPGHYCWDFIRSGDYEGFYRHEIALRQKNLYPPFIKMALVRSSWEKDDAEAENAWRRFAAEMKNAAGRCAAERPAAPAVIGMHQKPTADFLAAFANRREALSQGGHGLPRILGPSPAPHSFINGRHRAQIVIKAADWNSVRSLYAAALNRTSAKGRLPGSLRISLDLDPVNML